MSLKTTFDRDVCFQNVGSYIRISMTLTHLDCRCSIVWWTVMRIECRRLHFDYVDALHMVYTYSVRSVCIYHAVPHYPHFRFR
jgi:hypothetical protein